MEPRLVRCRSAVSAFLGLLLLCPTPSAASSATHVAPAPGPFAVAVVSSDDPALAEPVPRDQPLTADEVLAMTRRAVALAGGMEAFVCANARLVVIKPNVVVAAAPGTGMTTDPQVVRAVAVLVHEAAPAARLLIAEGPGGWVSPGHGANTGSLMGWFADVLGVNRDGFEVGGYRAVAAELRARGLQIDCLDLNFDDAVSVPVPGGGLAMPHYEVAATIMAADAWINCPVMKSHGSKITCCLKNAIGILPGNLYGFSKDRGTDNHPGIVHTPSRIDELLVDLWAVSRVDLNVVDGIVGREGGAFDGGTAVRTNLVLAGRDPVATDLVAAQLMGFNPDDMEPAELARRCGMGPGSIRGVTVCGGRVERLRHRYRKAGGAYGSGSSWAQQAVYGMGPRYWTFLGPLPAGHRFSDAELAALAPAPGVAGWSPPIFFGHDVIDPSAALGNPQDCTVYAATRFTMPETAQTRLWVSSQEDLTIWIDGRQVYQFAGRRTHRLGADRVPLQVDAGAHRLLVRATQGRGDIPFSLNLCEPVDDEAYAGNRYPGLLYWNGD